MWEEFDPNYLEPISKARKRDFRIALLIAVILLVGFLIIWYFKGLSEHPGDQSLQDDTRNQIERILEESGEK